MRVTRVLRSHLGDIDLQHVGQREADDCLRLAVALLPVPVVVGILRRRLLLDEVIELAQ